MEHEDILKILPDTNNVGKIVFTTVNNAGGYTYSGGGNMTMDIYNKSGQITHTVSMNGGMVLGTSAYGGEIKVYDAEKKEIYSHETSPNTASYTGEKFKAAFDKYSNISGVPIEYKLAEDTRGEKQDIFEKLDERYSKDIMNYKKLPAKEKEALLETMKMGISSDKDLSATEKEELLKGGIEKKLENYKKLTPAEKGNILTYTQNGIKGLLKNTLEGYVNEVAQLRYDPEHSVFAELEFGEEKIIKLAQDKSYNLTSEQDKKQFLENVDNFINFIDKNQDKPLKEMFKSSEGGVYFTMQRNEEGIVEVLKEVPVNVINDDGKKKPGRDYDKTIKEIYSPEEVERLKEFGKNLRDEANKGALNSESVAKFVYNIDMFSNRGDNTGWEKK